MNIIEEIVRYIVLRTLELNSLYLSDENARINYSAIFCQSEDEFEKLNLEAAKLGMIVDNTPTGPLYKLINPIKTVAGPLWLIKIRKPYATHPQRGDADFTLKDYQSFKNKYLSDSQHFFLIIRENFEMIELRDERFDVLSYFSSSPLTEEYGIK